MRQEAIRRAAHHLVNESGLINLTAKKVCERAQVPEGSFFTIMGVQFTDFLNDLKATMPNVEHKLKKGRTTKDVRKKSLTETALQVAIRDGFANISLLAIANEAEVSRGLVTHYLGTLTDIKRTVMRAAIAQRNAEIVMQGLAVGDIHAKKADDTLKAEAAILMMG